MYQRILYTKPFRQSNPLPLRSAPQDRPDQGANPLRNNHNTIWLTIRHRRRSMPPKSCYLERYPSDSRNHHYLNHTSCKVSHKCHSTSNSHIQRVVASVEREEG